MDKQMIAQLARKVFYRYVAGSDLERTLSLEELVSEGIHGYLQAERRLDRERYPDPKPFLAQRVRGQMVDRIRKEAFVSLPPEKYGLLKELQQAETACKTKRGQIAEEDLAEVLGWSVEKVREIRACALLRVEPEQPIAESGETRSLLENLPGIQGASSNPFDAVQRKELAALVHHCLKQLSDRRRRLILTMRHLQEATLKEIGSRLDTSEQNVKYHQDKAEEQMKSCLRDQGVQVEDVRALG